MKEYISKFVIFCLILFAPLIVFSSSSLELKQQIEEKNQQLQEIIKQRDKVLQKIEGLKQEKNSLGKEIKKYNYYISQLSLEIKSGEIILSRINLEIEELKSEISNIDEDLNSKRNILRRTLQKIAEKDREPFLIVFLKNQTLGKSIDEIQEIISFNNKLTHQLKELELLKEEKNRTLKTISEKKKLKEIENSNSINKKKILKEQRRDKEILLSKTRNRESLYKIELKRLEKIRNEVSLEIEKIEKELRKKINPELLPIPRPGVLLKPLQGILTQGYGYTNFARTHYKSKRHNGIDIAAPLGAPIKTAEEGEVIAVENQDRYCWHGAYGKYIVVKHPNNLTTLYAHLSRQTVKVGDKIRRGQIIGYVGNTGYCVGRNGGAHLHFGVYSSPTFYIGTSRLCGPMPYGGDLNPLDYLQL